MQITSKVPGKKMENLPGTSYTKGSNEIKYLCIQQEIILSHSLKLPKKNVIAIQMFKIGSQESKKRNYCNSIYQFFQHLTDILYKRSKDIMSLLF